MNKTVLLGEDSPDEMLLARRAFARAGRAVLREPCRYWMDLNVPPAPRGRA